MNQEMAIYVLRETLFTALLLAAPMLLTGLVVGLTISILQSVTQIQEMTLTFIPKILSVALVMLLAMPWMLNLMQSYTNQIYEMVSTLTK